MNDYIHHIIYIRTRAIVKMLFALIALVVYLVITFLPIAAIITAILTTTIPTLNRLILAGWGLLASAMGRPLTVMIKSWKNI